MLSNMIFADNSTSTTVDVASLADKLGPSWFFAALSLVAFIIVVIGLGWVLYKFGNKLLDRLDGFLAGMSEATASNTVALRNQEKVGIASAKNIASLCEAGHSFANAVEKIGREMGADVRPECDKIHEKLQTIASA